MPYRRIGQEEDVEGQGLRLKDLEGNEWIIAGDRVKSIAWRGPDGEEQTVEGHGIRGRLEQEPDVEGHVGRLKFRDDQGNEQELTEPFRVTYLDDDGNEQDVEGHAHRVSDLRLKHDVERLGDVLSRLRAISR